MSIILYSFFLIPGFNLIPPMILFLGIYFGCRRLPFAKGWDVLPAYIGLGVLLVINVVFIVDIELTRGFNSILQGKDEAEFGFGQILSILLLLLPLRDLAEAVLARRIKQRQAELDEDLQEAIINEDFNGLKRAINRGGTFPSSKSPDRHGKFWGLISANEYLDHFDNLRRTRMTNAEKELEGDLHSAIRAKDESRMTVAYNQGADLIAGVLQLSEGVVFWYAISRGLKQIAWFHAQQPGPHVTEPGPDGTTVLILASSNGDELLAKTLLENRRVDVNFQDASGQTALLCAAENGRDAIVKMLIEQRDIQLNTADENGWTPLLWASCRGHESIVEMLLGLEDIQANVSDRNGPGWTPLIWASMKGHEGIVKMLIEREDIKANAADKEGWTPLMFASHNGYEGIVRVLLDRPDIQLDATTQDGKTAHGLALQNGSRSIAELIFQRYR
ncbi:ankyrin repeat-containing domain protein [Coprinopsis sp. MPI-PUGE-AT-0042]|nr:ankyrin repeat-containing domain protein [Coprinopsis sp. MPI-PUGE-AT-0042]